MKLSHRSAPVVILMRLVLVLAPLVLEQTAHAVAGIRTIGTYTGTPSGMAFDDDPNPLMVDSFTSILRRVDLNTGSVLSTTTLSSNNLSSLTWDGADQKLFTTDISRSLCTINPATGVVTRLPQAMPGFNFWDIEWDSVLAKMWVVTDINGGEIYTVNTTTGAATFQRNFGVFALNGGGIQSMAVGAGGEMIVAGETNPNSGPDLWRVNPITGSVALAADLPFPQAGVLLRDLDYNPATNRWFAVEENRNASPDSYSLIELTNVPEPATLAPLCTMIATTLLSRCFRQPKQIATPN